ncbi:MAG: hypothetical protein KDC82_06235, partial [Bacteroidetes bacterium]|nr:hypothetical protein [Bacteroidota bacterium]
MKNSIKICLLFFAFASQLSYAQEEGNLGSEDIIVVKDYEARIVDAEKIKINPNIPEIETEKLVLEYNVPSKLLELNYPPHTLKPYSMPKVKSETFNDSYIRLGFGTQFSPLAEVVYMNDDVKNTVFGAYYKHLSAYGKTDNQKFRDNDLGTFVKYYLKKTELGANFNFMQNQDYFYGYNHADTSFTSKEINHRLREIGGSLYLKNAGLNEKNFDHFQELSTSFTNDNFDVNE